MIVQRSIGWLLAVIAGVLILPQVFADVPRLGVITWGFVLALVALGLLEDAQEKELGL